MFLKQEEEKLFCSMRLGKAEVSGNWKQDLRDQIFPGITELPKAAAKVLLGDCCRRSLRGTIYLVPTLHFPNMF